MKSILGALLLLVPGPYKPATTLSVSGTQFTVNGQKTFLLGCSYYGALTARDEWIRADLRCLRRWGFNWIRVWATWAPYDLDVSVVDDRGQLRWGLHGRIANRPAHRVEITVDGQTGRVTVCGTVDESRFHFQKLRLESTLVVSPESNRLEIHDRVTNLSGAAATMRAALPLVQMTSLSALTAALQLM